MGPGTGAGNSQNMSAGQQQQLNQLLSQVFSQQMPNTQPRRLPTSSGPQTSPMGPMTLDQGFLPPQAQTLPYEQQGPGPGLNVPFDRFVTQQDLQARYKNPNVAGPVQPRITADNWAGQPLEAQRVRDRRHQPGKVWNPFAGRFGTGKMVAGDPTVNEFGEKYATTYIGRPQTNLTDPEGNYGTWNNQHTMYTPKPGRYLVNAADAKDLGYKWPGGYDEGAAEI